jgi:hypothetical protein
MTKQTRALYDALPDFAKAYIDLLLENKNFWPEDDDAEIRRWIGADEESFTPESYQRIANDCAKFLEMIAQVKSVKAVLDDLDTDALAYSFYMCRMGTGHEPYFGNKAVEDAIEAAAEEMGEAFAEVGWWRRITYYEHS